MQQQPQQPQQPQQQMIEVSKRGLMTLGATMLASQAGPNVFAISVELAELFKKEFPEDHRKIMANIAERTKAEKSSQNKPTSIDKTSAG